MTVIAGIGIVVMTVTETGGEIETVIDSHLAMVAEIMSLLMDVKSKGEEECVTERLLEVVVAPGARRLPIGKQRLGRSFQ